MNPSPDAPSALRLKGLRKQYGRSGPKALDGLSCRFPQGAVCGLVGPNGAGKTTLFSVVCGYLPPDAGTVEILGEPGFDPWRLKGRLGVLPQDAEINANVTCRGFLVYMARLQGLAEGRIPAEVQRALAAVHLADRADQPAGSLSHGMRRRLSAISALMGDPELVLLDEPMAGLDPVEARALRQLIMARRGASTLVVSSHNLDELERICDWVVLMDRGRLVREGTVQDVTGSGQEVRWVLGPGRAPLDELRTALPEHRIHWHPGEGASVLVQVAPIDGDLDASAVVIARALSQAGVPIREVRRGKRLEESFLQSTGRSP